MAHRFDAWTHTLERQRLPRREQFDLAGRHVLHEVVVQVASVGSGRTSDDEWAALTQLRERGDGDSAGGFGYSYEPTWVAQRLHKCRIVAQ